MVNSLNTYLTIILIVTVLIISLQVLLSTKLVSKAAILYKTTGWFKSVFWLLLLLILGFVLFQVGGGKLIVFLLILGPEYKHLTVVAILTFLLLVYVRKRSLYEHLEIFGSVLLICWAGVFGIITFIHFVIHFQLLQAGIGLFIRVNNIMWGGYKVIPYLIILTTLVDIYLLIDIAVRKVRRILIDYLEKKIRISYQGKIIELIYDDIADNVLMIKEQGYFKRVKRLFFTRQIFTEELLRMHEVVLGQLHDRINFVFNMLLLSNDSYNYLHHRRWYYKVNGLRIYAQLGNRKDISYIRKLANTGNSVLRSEAQLALARLSEDENPFGYLKDTRKKLTDWEQINLIHYYTHHQKPVGDLSELLLSENDSVVLFGLNCIRAFNKFDYRDKIIEFTKHRDLRVKNTAIELLEMFDEPEVANFVMSCYDDNLPVSTRMRIVRTLGKIGNEETIDFLKQQIVLESTLDISIELLRALNSIAPQAALDIANSDSTNRLQRIFDHIIDN
ncbi:MAG: HEAT repeat domain-containing protein [Paludibacter sp.]|nr:HEAT repeat domain-containing protein [Paludibacter sp.]